MRLAIQAERVRRLEQEVELLSNNTPTRHREADNYTDHGALRSSQRAISYAERIEAIKTAKESGNVVTKTGKYGTTQTHYTGTNKIRVIIENEGRNAGRVITIYRIQ